KHKINFQSCYVAANSIEEERSSGIKDALVELVDRRHTLKVNGELRFMAPEGLFRPQLWAMELPGLHRMVHEAIQKCPIDSRRTLYRNIYLTGGTSQLR
uniref:Actin-related protein 5 n=1 Tax=Globodera pallida TaxID=36090 RepID=A0A183CSL5_GLOPA